MEKTVYNQQVARYIDERCEVESLHIEPAGLSQTGGCVASKGNAMGVQRITSLQGPEFETVHDGAAELFELQLEQFRHDETYHREIARLSVQHRLNHMVLHLSKYLGLFANNTDVDEQRLNRAIIDSIIIGLSTANILNLRLADRLIGPNERPLGLSDLCMHFAAQMGGADSLDRDFLVKRTAIAVGRMAKGCESVDHLESFPFREAITDGLIDALRVLLATAAARGVDVSTSVRARLGGVKSKSIFHGHL
jgi:hypothetical protein